MSTQHWCCYYWFSLSNGTLFQKWANVVRCTVWQIPHPTLSSSFYFSFHFQLLCSSNQIAINTSVSSFSHTFPLSFFLFLFSAISYRLYSLLDHYFLCIPCKCEYSERTPWWNVFLFPFSATFCYCTAHLITLFQKYSINYNSTVGFFYSWKLTSEDCSFQNWFLTRALPWSSLASSFLKE